MNYNLKWDLKNLYSIDEKNTVTKWIIRFFNHKKFASPFRPLLRLIFLNFEQIVLTQLAFQPLMYHLWNIYYW